MNRDNDELLIPETLLAQIPAGDLVPRLRVIRRLSTGTAHRNWHIRTARGDFVLRAPNPALPMMSERDFERELLLQRHAAAQGMAPKVFACNRPQRSMVMEYIDGTQWADGDFREALRLSDLCSRLAQLHAVAAPAVPAFDPLSNIQSYARQLLAAMPPDSAGIDAKVTAATRIWTSGGASAQSSAILHCDPHAGNLISRGAAMGSSAIVLLDWEYAQVGDPILDFAALCSYYPQAEPVVTRWLAAAPAPAAGVLQQRLRGAIGVFCVLNWLWYRVRAMRISPAAADVAQMRQLDGRIDALLLG